MKRRHPAFFSALCCICLATGSCWAVPRNLVFFFSPTQVAAKNARNKTFRIGGLVGEGTLKKDPDGLTVRFTVTDTAHSIPVVYKGILPDLFTEGRGCVAQGRMNADGMFYADQIMAKHDENYMPPEAAEALDKAKQAEKIQKHTKDAAKTLSK